MYSFLFHYFSHFYVFSIDATAETGRLGRLLNHSRLNPNCITKVIQIEKQEQPRLVLIAKCDIDAGTGEIIVFFHESNFTRFYFIFP